MTNIEVKILNPEVLAEAEKMMVCAARLTQRGEKIKNLDDFMGLYEASYTQKTVKDMAVLPHNTIRQFNMVNVVVVGASRRFLAQITRRRVGVTFTSASLQYSDYSDDANFVVPYEIMEKGQKAISAYLASCQMMMSQYKSATSTFGIDKDAAGYMAPQGLANILMISATPQAWIEMIRQRVCRRNTKETQYVLLLIWEQLAHFNPRMYAANVAGPPCSVDGTCPEGKMACGRPIERAMAHPRDLIALDFPLLRPGL